jgi:LemA protein
VVVENYPNIKSNENFLRLQDESGRNRESHRGGARQVQQVVQQYNTDIELFPKNIAASLFGFHRKRRIFQGGRGFQGSPQGEVLIAYS